ncbi:pyridoxal-phosphate dependent enzyme [Candidatus Dojkabacteria bacterium]|uniref:Pyridoxal-phosphate dependent enzyme n=1 Tax=Candidatus Dojkabacteria bacterium TaxID=2099670 RepID=A0A3M0YZR9_9BACT|nr:MAG: pyridoxal-phosphate dependent enzyme [Candidatus Dojkabacteria bacterium]
MKFNHSMNMDNLNTFVGENSLLDFLNPKKTITPLVELPSKLNRFKKENGVRIFIKLMSHTTLFNVKHVTVYSMLENFKKKGSGIVESSSGNTAFTLSILAKYFGYEKTKFFFSHRVPIDKLNLIKLVANEIEIIKEPLCPDKNDPNSSINKAKKLSKESDYDNLDQYSNPSNPKGHYEITGKQIVEQLKHLNLNIDYLFAAVGTTGTIVGSSLKIKEHFPKLKTVGVASADDMTRLGARSKNSLEEIYFDWRSYVDDLIEVNVECAFLHSIKLIKHGLLVGPSTGHIFAGLLKYIEDNNLKNVNLVFVSCDTFLPYVNEYIKYLSNKHLADVVNEDLALSYANIQSRIRGRKYDQFKILPEVFVEKYKNLDKTSICLDVRKDSEYDSFRLKNTVKINLHDLEHDILGFVENLGNYHNVYILDCGMSDAAKLACLILRDQKINAYWIEGGIDYISKKWSNLILRSGSPI